MEATGYVLRILGEPEESGVVLSQAMFDCVMNAGATPPSTVDGGEGGAVAVSEVSGAEPGVAEGESLVEFGVLETVPEDADFVWDGTVVDPAVVCDVFASGLSAIIRQEARAAGLAC